MKRLVPVILVMLLSAPARAGDATIDDLAWMAGYWTLHSDDGSRFAEELWLAPAAGWLMVGVHRDTRNNERAFFEYLRIETRSDGVFYVSKPSNQEEAAFRLIEHTPGARAVFENAEHDFPQRIIYERSGDTLTASISGTIDGKERSSSWSFTRTQFDKEGQ